MNCKFSRTCKKYNTEDCSNRCYPYVMLHGLEGVGGFWNTTNIPKKYKDNLLNTLPHISPVINERIESYVKQIVDIVLNKNIGLYLCGGTGTGKTTIATTLLNEYLIERVRLHLRGELQIKVNPCLFVRVSEFQNIFNAQFRGGEETKIQNADRFYALKEQMKAVELLVLDDIALRECSESFGNELYDIIDYRATNEGATIFTSNEDFPTLKVNLGERTASRIEGMAIKLVVNGKDHRKGGIFNNGK